MAYNLPATYQPNWGSSGIGQQVYPNYQQTVPQMSGTPQGAQGLIWVDGEVGARAYQMPQGWPANQPIALWDTNDTVIYLKSMNPMGMPNPLQRAHYTLEERKGASPMSGNTAPETSDMTQYVRKEDMERMRQELMDAIGNANMGARHAVKGES